MDRRRNSEYDKNNSKNNSDEVVKMLTMPLTKAATTKTGIKVEKNPKKKRSALEISNSIGVHGAFGRTLSDLHKQGR